MSSCQADTLKEGHCGVSSLTNLKREMAPPANKQYILMLL